MHTATGTSGLHTRGYFTSDLSQRSPSRGLEPFPFTRPGISADFERLEGRSLLDAAASGRMDTSKFFEEEATRAREILALVEARKAIARDNVVQELNHEAKLVQTTPIGSRATLSKHPLVDSETKYFQFKDRVAGGCGLPLELTAEDRDVVYFLQQFAKGNVDTANECLVHKTVEAECVDCHGNNALHYACRAGNLEGAEFAQVLKIDLDTPNKGGMRALHYAVVHAAGETDDGTGRLTPVLQWLVMTGASLSVETSSGLTPEALARSIGATSVAEWLHLCCTVPSWGPSKETVENGGPNDAQFRAPFTADRGTYVPKRRANGLVF